MIQVGDPLTDISGIPENKRLKRVHFNTGEEKWFLRKDIINADSQMQSLIEAGVNIIYGYLGERKSITAMWAAGRRIRQLIREHQIDIVHVLWGTTTSLFTVLFSNKPVVISFSGSDLIGLVKADGSLTKSAYLSVPLSKISAFFAAHIITKSEDMKQRLPAFMHGKTTVIPNGVDLRGFYPMTREKSLEHTGWNPARRHVIFFNGSGDFVKDQTLAENVFSLVKQQLPETEFHILRNIAHTDLLYYYNAADLMLLTSYHEGSNNSVKEAIACNTPIVSTDCGDTGERLSGCSNCFVVPSRSSAELAQKAICVLQSGGRSNAREKADEVSLTTIANKIIDIYNQVISR